MTSSRTTRPLRNFPVSSSCGFPSASGTGSAYSTTNTTLWLAEAARSVGGRVTTLEASDHKIKLAEASFGRSGLADRIDIVRGNAAHFLRAAESDAFDFVFLDSERSEYVEWWPDLKRIVRRGGLLVADNAVSHPHEIAPFIDLVQADAAFTTSLVPVGKGEFLAVKSSDPLPPDVARSA